MRHAVLLTLREHSGPVHAVAFSPDGSALASASEDRTIKLWDTHTGRVQLTLSEHTTLVPTIAFSPDGKRLVGHTQQVNVVAFSPDGNVLASCSDDGTIKFWDLKRV